MLKFAFSHINKCFLFVEKIIRLDTRSRWWKKLYNSSQPFLSSKNHPTSNKISTMTLKMPKHGWKRVIWQKWMSPREWSCQETVQVEKNRENWVFVENFTSDFFSVQICYPKASQNKFFSESTLNLDWWSLRQENTKHYAKKNPNNCNSY